MVSKAFVIVVGTGGIGSVVVAALSRTLSKDSVLMLIDGDRFERRNVARQMLFADATEGEFKADVLTRKYTWEHGPFITPVHGYICDKASEREERDGGVIIDTLASMLAPYDDTIDESFGGEATIICCSDNHAARRRCLTHGSMNRWGVILSGNELVEAEAYYAPPGSENSPTDPRMYYKALASDENDVIRPAAPRVGCDTRVEQTTIANMLAAAYVLFLFRLYVQKPVELCKEGAMLAPVRIASSGVHIVETNPEILTSQFNKEQEAAKKRKKGK